MKRTRISAMMFGFAVFAISVAYPVLASVPVSMNQTNMPPVLATNYPVPLAYSATGTNLAFILVSGPASGTLTYSTATNLQSVTAGLPVSTSLWYYTTAATNPVPDSFTWEVSDGTSTSGVATVTMIPAANHAPVSSGQTLSLAVGSIRRLVIPSFLDVDHFQPYTFTVLSQPANGIIEYGSGTNYTLMPANTPVTSMFWYYTPTGGVAGTDTFSWQVSDGMTTSAAADVVITLTTNTPPVANIQSVTVAAGTPYAAIFSRYLSWYDRDIYQPLTCKLVLPPSQGTLYYLAGTNYVEVPVDTPVAAGSWYYSSSATNQGVDTFMWWVSDGLSTSPVATTTITFTNNVAPAVNSVTNTLAVGSIRYPVYLSSSLMDSYHPLACQIRTPASRGVVEYVTSLGTYAAIPTNTYVPFISGQTLYYTPAGTNAGSDSFVWQLSDGLTNSGLATAVFTLTTNHPPVASTQSLAIVAGSIRTTCYLSSSHPDYYQPVSYQLLSAPTQGVMEINSGGIYSAVVPGLPVSSPFWCYTPFPGALGSDSLTWRMSDGFGNSGVATVSVTIAANQAPVATAVSGTTVMNVPVGLTLNATDDALSPFMLSYRIVQPPSNGTVTLQYPTLYPSYTCFIYYNPANGFTGTDTFTFVANDGFLDSSIATATVVVVTNTPPVVQPLRGRTTPGTAVQLAIPYTHPASDAGQVLTASVVSPPDHGTVTGGVGTTLTYTPAAGFSNGVDTFTFKLNDTIADSNVGTALVQVLAPGENGGNLVMLVVNSLLLPEITNEVTRLQNDLIAGGYTSTVVAWSNASANALWNCLHTTYTNRLLSTNALAGAILIGNIPANGDTDLDYWNMMTNIATTASTVNPGPFQIWVSRIWGVLGYNMSWGDEPTLIKRALQANHDYRTGASRLPSTAFAFDHAYGAEMNASQFQPPWPETFELCTGPSDTVNAALHPLGCYEAFLRGGDLLAEESHGQGDLYTINAGSTWLVDEPNLYHRMIQVRTVLNSSCEIGALGSIVNAQLFTRGGGNILSIGASQTTFMGAVIPDTGQVPALATGLSWGDALIQNPLQDQVFLIYYGDLSLPILVTPSNAMPVASLAATAPGASATAYSTNNIKNMAAPILKGMAPLTVTFTGAASDPDGTIALAEWFPETHDFGRNDPDVSETTPSPKSHTYYRAHRYLPRLEVADNYKARTFAETEIRVAPRCDRPLRVICGFTGEWTTYASPTLDYLSPTTGKLWLHDQLYANGTWGSSQFPYSGYGQTYSGVISGTPDPQLFQYAHYTGGSQFTIPITNGTYTLNLGFADVWSVAPGTRVLDVYLNGQKSATVDPYALAGKPQAAVTVPVPLTVATNLLTIRIGLNPASTVTNSAPGPASTTDGTWLNNFELVPAGYSNNPPVAVDDSATTPQGQATNVQVLANDSDPDGDETILVSVSTPANGAAIIDGQGILYSPRPGFAGTDTFTYVIADGNGGMATGTVTMTVAGVGGNHSPSAAPQATPAVSLSPLVASFTANATDPDGDPLTYLWDFNDGTTATNQDPVHAFTGVGVYTVTVTVDDGRGGTGSGQVPVAVAASPAITQQPVSTGAGGGQATFTVTASGSPYPSYQWLRNGAAIVGATGSSYTINTTYADFASLFSVLVSNSVGTVTSQTATLYAGLVNFQAATWTNTWIPPAGYAIDSGGFVNAALGYGWTVAQVSSRIRNINADRRLDSFVSVGASAANWIDFVPNGLYNVTLSCGDAGYASGPSLVKIQGAYAISNVSLGAGQFTSVSNFPAVVTNGQLVLTVGGSIGSTPLNYVMVQRAPSMVTVAADATPTNGMMPLAVQFAANGSESDGNPVTYLWTFGDGGTSTDPNPLYTYTNAGLFTATVVANSYGSQGSLSATSSVQIAVDSNVRTLTASVSGFGTGTVTLDPPGGVYPTGTVVTVTATAGLNSTFTGWSGDVTGTNNPVTLTMDIDHVVTASFGFNGYGITASAGAGGAISPSGMVGVVVGDSQTFMITPATWYAISGVTVDGAPVGAGASYTFSNVQTGHTISAVFAAQLAPLGTPLWWLAQYGYTNNEQALDPDGVPVWKDYLTGTNPTNPLSGPPYNIIPYAESFENLAGWGGVYTNVAGAMGWTSDASSFDQSRIVNLPYVYTATNLPLPAATHTNVLQLNTQWGTLTNSFGGGFDMGKAMVYLDMMMLLTPFNGGTPENFTMADTGVRGGVYVNASRQLTVYHGVAASDGSLASNVTDATSLSLDSTNWHRVTLVVDATVTNPATAPAMFQVRVDGVTVTNPAAYGDDWKAQYQNTGLLPSTVATGTWFRLATTNATARMFTGLCFTGSGYADDVVVSTVNPFSSVGATCLLIVTTSGNGGSSLGTGSYVALPVAVGANTQIVYTAGEWCRIASFVSNGIPAPSAVGVRVFTQVLANVSADLSNAVVFAQATPSQVGATNMPVAWLTNWTEEAVQAVAGQDGFSLDAKYLLGLDPTASNSYQLSVEQVTVSGSNVVMTVRRRVTGNLAPDGMHGYLELQAAGDLGGVFSNVAGTELTGSAVFDGAGYRAYTNVVMDSRKFFRAVVE